MISKEKKQINIDFFDVGLTQSIIEFEGYFIYFWGIGEIKNHKINGKIAFSFPLSESLLDRNILISFQGDKIIVENDWLGSIPVFYNIKENIISTISNFCIEGKTIDFEGLENFCEFGYSVFEHTFLQDVRFMRYYSTLTIDAQSGIKIDYKEDLVLEESFFKDQSEENDVISLMQDYIGEVEKVTKGDIVLPTSGGYDSRILNYLVKDKKRIRSFTYGISKNQSESVEVTHAKKISEIYKTKWEQIELNRFHQYISKWFDIYGISTHIHGMYHIEFYTKILSKYKFENPTFLSGIVGDAWAGSIMYNDIKKQDDLISLGYTHGLNLDLGYLQFSNERIIIQKIFSENKDFLKNDKTKAVFTIRIKLMLISYLTQIPEYFGMPVWTPFLNFEIVKQTLNIDEDRRKNRIWQRDFFRKVGLNLEDMKLKSTWSNRLDYEAARHTHLEQLDVELMSTYVSRKRLLEINKYISSQSTWQKMKNELLYLPKIGGAMRKFGFKNKFLVALYDYYIIKTIEKGIKYEP